MKVNDLTKLHVIKGGVIVETTTWEKYKALVALTLVDKNAIVAVLDAYERLISDKGFIILNTGEVIAEHGAVKFRASIERRGAMTEFVYGKGLAALTARAVRKLNEDIYSTTPEKVEVFLNDCGHRYVLLNTIPYVKPK